jgi:mono/diheme cytochrome c family protein
MRTLRSLWFTLPMAVLGCGPSSMTDAGDGDGDRPSFFFGDGDGGNAVTDEAPDSGSTPDGGAIGGDTDGGGDGDVATGAELYAVHCASCHGANGTGGTSPALAGTALDFDALTARIDATMPLGSPESCTGACASAVAAFILSLPTPPALCESTTLQEPALRLLSREQVAATLGDLLAPLTPSCAALSSCDVAHESCTEGMCAPDACATKTFIYTPGATMPSTVHVAGGMNGWAPTIAEGGWPLTYDDALGVFIAKREVSDGDHQYKLVIDESTWVADAANPLTAPDGFGGQNSRLVVTCAGASPPVTLDFADEMLTADIPPSVRTPSFPFDGRIESGLITTAHIDAMMLLSDRVAEHVKARLPRLLPCSTTTPDVACADLFVDAFAARAWRRPIALDERERIRGVITSAPSFDEGVHRAVQMLLLSPGFLYRSELGELDGTGTRTLTDHEVASALSYFITGSMPDEILFALADAGVLHDATVRAEEAARLLASPRADVMLARFVESWLGIENIMTVSRIEGTGAFTPAVRQRMLDETRALFIHVARHGSLDDLFTSSVSFGDQLLASFYGLSSTNGSFTMPLDRQGGILGHGSVLAVLAYPTETAPVRRGLFVRERLLCQHLGIPPPNAGGVPDVDPNATTRERFEQHSTNPTCYACHRYIDDVGFGLERYDHTGRWRETDNGLPIDATGDMNDVEGLGTMTSSPFEGPRALGQALANSDAARTCFVSQVARYQSGKDDVDACALSTFDTAFIDAGEDILSLFITLAADDRFIRRGE